MSTMNPPFLLESLRPGWRAQKSEQSSRSGPGHPGQRPMGQLCPAHLLSGWCPEEPKD